MASGSSIPKFAELPIHEGAPPESAWGVFGDDDEVGTVNFLTPERVLEATKLVREGKVFRLDLPMDLPRRPPDAEGRRPIKHSFVISHRRYTGLSDRLDDFDTQATTQWDGLKHHHHPEHGYYNGHYEGLTAKEVMQTVQDELGIQHLADRLVGRGVLIDAAKYRDEQGRPVDPTSGDFIPLTDLKAAVREQGVEIRPGDILLIRTGFMRWYLDSYETVALGPSNGIEPGRDTAEWLWDSQIAAVAADNVAVEPVPWLDDLGPLHYRLIPLLGMPLGELFNLEELAADCAADGVYECMITSAPFRLRGGVASPPNVIALK